MRIFTTLLVLFLFANISYADQSVRDRLKAAKSNSQKSSNQQKNKSINHPTSIKVKTKADAQYDSFYKSYLRYKKNPTRFNVEAMDFKLTALSLLTGYKDPRKAEEYKKAYRKARKLFDSARKEANKSPKGRKAWAKINREIKKDEVFERKNESAFASIGLGKIVAIRNDAERYLIKNNNSLEGFLVNTSTAQEYCGEIDKHGFEIICDIKDNKTYEFRVEKNGKVFHKRSSDDFD